MEKLSMDIGKYWFISEFYWPIENSTGHILTRIVDAFTKVNEAYVITSSGNNSNERNKNIHAIRIKEYFNLNKNNLFQRMIKMIILSFNISISIIKNVKKEDTIVAVTNPALILMFLAYIRIFKKFKFIVFVHDIFPENLLVSHIISRRSLLYKISTKIFNYAYRKADLLITCGRDMQKTIIQKIKNKNKVLFIPNFCDNDLLYPVNKKENIIIQNLNLYDKLVVFFTGNIGRMQNIDYLIETAELLKDDDLISFLFIGNGVYQNKVENYSKKNKNVFFVPAMERRDAIVFLNAGDVGISTLLPHMMGVGVPSKTYSYMATGKPIIAVMDTDSEIAMMVQEEENGWVVEASNPKQLASLLKQLKEVPGIIKEKGRKSFELSRTKYSVENITVQYVDAILNL